MEESGVQIGEGTENQIKKLRIENANLKLQVIELQSMILQHQHNEQMAILESIKSNHTTHL
jgi:hypothetical protein